MVTRASLRTSQGPQLRFNAVMASPLMNVDEGRKCSHAMAHCSVSALEKHTHTHTLTHSCLHTHLHPREYAHKWAPADTYPQMHADVHAEAHVPTGTESEAGSSLSYVF